MVVDWGLWTINFIFLTGCLTTILLITKDVNDKHFLPAVALRLFRLQKDLF